MMKRLQYLLLVLLLSLLLTACGTDGVYSLMIITEGQHKLAQSLQGELILLGGEVTLPASAVVDGNIHFLSGKLAVEGEVTGDIAFLNGDLTLGPSARIRGDLKLGGGSFHPSPDAVIEGGIDAGSGVSLPSVPNRETVFTWSFWLRAIIDGLLSGLIAVMVVRYFPLAVGRIGNAITSHSLASGAMGILVGIVGVSLLVTMAYTILLIPVSLLLLFVLAAGVFLGWIGLSSELGRFLARLTKRPVNPSKAAFFGMLVFMPGLQLLSFIPVIGGLLGISLAAAGLGAVSLTRFGLRRFVPASDENLSAWPG